jgi:hypothetical protein
VAAYESLPASVSIVDSQGRPNRAFAEWLRKTVEAQVADILAVQAAADAAQAAADTAQAAADTAQAVADTATTAAETAQAAADAAQTAVDSLIIPPTGTLNVSASAALTADDVTVLANATGGAITLTLPAASSSITPISITKVDGSANAVNVVPGGGDQLNGGAGPVSLTLSLENKSFVSDQASEWYG